MKMFSCDCGNLTHFENVACVSCWSALAFLPEEMDLVVVVPDGRTEGLLRVQRDGSGDRYRMCRNGQQFGACNWLVKAGEEPELCLACRLNRIVPPLAEPGARTAWIDIERAKRRLVYGLLDLGLPVASKADDPEHGLAFAFLEQQEGAPKIVTGHAGGVITLDIAEADEPYREHARQSLGETYRTLLGHLRHEVGHYYWDRFFAGDEDQLAAFRALFGDEHEDYPGALERHYAGGAPADWQTRFVSAYASSHPWEDWAETWAHYLHIRDLTQTAASFGMTTRPRDQGGRLLREVAFRAGPSPADDRSFTELLRSFPPLTVAINALNRSMGLPDAYPFVLSEGAIAKMRFVHDTAARAARRRSMQFH
jgi:hypothetical protein